MANLLFGYRLLEADVTTAVSGPMKASTFGSTADKARLYYLELYAKREANDTGGNLRLDGFDIKVSFSDTILASLNQTLASTTREGAITVNSGLPIFRDIQFGAVTDGASSVRFTAGSTSNIGDGGGSSPYPDTGTGVIVSAGETEVLARIKLDINDSWNKDSSVAAPTPAITGAQINIDDTVVTVVDTNQVQSIRDLRAIGASEASLQAFDTTVSTEVERSDQSLIAKGSSADTDAAFAERIGTTRTVGLMAAETTNLVRKGTTFTDSAWLVNSGESALVNIEAVKTGSISNGSITLAIEQKPSSSYDFSAVKQINHDASSVELDDINYQIDSAGTVTARGEIKVTRTLIADGEVGSVLTQNGAGGVDIQAYADGEATAEVIKSIEGTTSKNLITYQGDLNYDGRVSMKDLAFLNAGAEAKAKDGTYHAEVDADFNGNFTISDLAVLDADWGQSMHTQPSTGVIASDGTTTIHRSYEANAELSWSELNSQGSYTWSNSSFTNQSQIEAGADFVETLTT
jgi:hypothetical protein